MFFFKIYISFLNFFNFLFALFSAVCLFLFISTFVTAENHTNSITDVRIIFLVFTLVGYLFHRLMKYHVRMRARGTLYKEVLHSNYIRSVNDLAVAVNQPVAEVRKTLATLQTMKLLTDLPFSIGTLNTTDSLEDDEEEDDDEDYDDRPAIRVSVRCINCGASNIITSGTYSPCEYCGTKLTVPKKKKTR